MIGSNANTAETLTCGRSGCHCVVDSATIYCSDWCETNSAAEGACSCAHRECIAIAGAGLCGSETADPTSPPPGA
jgi:hypothetical protein